MGKEKPDIEADIKPAQDRGEDTAAMEPLKISDNAPRREVLTELAMELAAKSAGFSRSLPGEVVSALAELVRSMNCYYSNLIEGHDTHPIDIERALQNDYSDEPRKRDLQLEARAHVTVQQWIDEGGLTGRTTTTEGICEIHRQFGEALPDELLCDYGDSLLISNLATKGRHYRDKLTFIAISVILTAALIRLLCCGDLVNQWLAR